MGILQVFDKFYTDVEEGAKPEPGQICWVPVPETNEVPRILDVERVSPDEHYATQFEITDVDGRHFKSRERLPIKRLQLADTEELLIAKAKRRPAIILANARIGNLADIPAGTQQRLAKPLDKESFLVAPMYSVSDMKNPGTFGPALVARIRALQYLHLFCLPDYNDTSKPQSIVRLDRIFPSHLGRGCTMMNKKVHEEPFEVILSQLSILMGGVYRDPYDLVKELAQEALPD